MIREKRYGQPKVIDLNGPDGNAYSLMAYGSQYARILGLDWKEIRKEMMSGDYENLIRVFDEHFGAYVILER